MLSRDLYTHNFVPRTCGSAKAQSLDARTTEGAKPLELSIEDLPAVCPNASSLLWALHPQVFLDVVNHKEARCPYCGTQYRLHRDIHANDHEFGRRDLHQHRTHGGAETHEKIGSERPFLPVSRPRFQNLSADAFGNTTLELITRWLKGERA